jgi:four helix bundle protein
MSRDHRKLEAFQLADSLIVDLYLATKTFPFEERFGLQSQLRRGAVSVTANLVEGSARSSERDYLHFVAIALGSASEVRYLIELAIRLRYVDATSGRALVHGYDRVVRALQGLVSAISGRSPRSEARSPK